MAVVLAGCTTTPLLQTAAQTVQLFRQAPDAYPRTRENIDALPYAQLGVRFGSAPPAIFVLAKVRDDRQYWVSANNLLLVIRHGRIVETRGFPVDIQISSAAQADWLPHYQPGTAPPQAGVLALRVPAVPELSGTLETHLRTTGIEQLDIHGFHTEALRVEERISAPALEWSAVNVYWMSLRSNLAWRSLQHLGPDLPPVQIELLKRPG